MSYGLSSLDLHYAIEELQMLKEAKVSRIYSPGKKELLFQLFIASSKKKLLRLKAPGYIYLSDFKEEQAERPSGFCSTLRKHLEGARLKEIAQNGFERIVEFVFESKNGRYRLIAELFSKGNIILCSDDLTIIMPAESQDWKDRSIRPKLKYTYPKKGPDIQDMKAEELIDILVRSKKSIVKLLAVEFGFGGGYAEEICVIAAVEKSSEKLDDKEAKKIISSAEKLLSMKISPRIYSREGSAFAIAPFEMTTQKGTEEKLFKSYNEALDYLFSHEIELSRDSRKLSQHNSKIDRLSKIVESQKVYLAELEKEIDEETNKADAIYSNYALIEEIRKELTKARTKYSLKEMKEKLKDHKIVKDINGKDKSVLLEL